MKKITSIFTLTFFVLVLVSGLALTQSVDLSGTWVGETEVPDEIEPDELTLVLKKENGEYTGKMSDSMGMLEETDCEDIEFKDNKLTFNIEVNTGMEYLRVYLTLTVEGDTMTGYWEAEDGSGGAVEMKKK
ncbi:MAG: hypothetical protein PVF22_03650 [Candidatus Aminicenantes bacterium]|jgi:hypothetical protein